MSEEINYNLLLKTLNGTIELLEEENKQLKEMQCAFLGTGCTRRRQQLEQVLDEIREVIIELRNIIYNPDYENFGLSREQYKDRFIHIFEILDKVNIDPNDVSKMFKNCTTLEPFLEHMDKVRK